MDIKQFKESKQVSAHIIFKKFSATIKYSAPGSGHYFTLQGVYGDVNHFIVFLDKFEQNYTFCVITEDEKFRIALDKRGYTPNEHGHMRIGIREETGAERFEREQREKLTLPRGSLNQTRHGRKNPAGANVVKARKEQKRKVGRPKKVVQEAAE